MRKVLAMVQVLDEDIFLEDKMLAVVGSVCMQSMGIRIPQSESLAEEQEICLKFLRPDKVCLLLVNLIK
jgi:hypothetical protein